MEDNSKNILGVEEVINKVEERCEMPEMSTNKTLNQVIITRLDTTGTDKLTIKNDTHNS